ncbi:hypothetical protein DUI87_06450 [Hirundo rustica rustica]|uniref:AT-rich interactive domain-containing protein 3 n=1 Tax=Hirundo rustica rustica TaxID=333673 RepID=A0A3M0KYG8_HIRRU|nr:hypothetical protein DUI87_06450 [Hirundo rustica rustica]
MVENPSLAANPPWHNHHPIIVLPISLLLPNPISTLLRDPTSLVYPVPVHRPCIITACPVSRHLSVPTLLPGHRKQEPLVVLHNCPGQGSDHCSKAQGRGMLWGNVCPVVSGVPIHVECLPGALYELDEDPKRKEFLDDLFGFMQKRGTPVNRIPIMAKQVLDLYTLYQLVTDKGGLVEVINKKIWREITKGLNLPTSITSAAFTLRTQYMKYLYPYECEKRALSSPGELQAAIDSNRREGRRQTFGTALFNYSPASTPTLLGTPKMPLPALSISTHSCGQLSQVHSIKKEDGMLAASVPGRIAIPVGLASHHLTAAQAAAASQAVVLEQLREKLETGEPPEKKVALTAEEQQRLVQHALQQNLLAMASQFPMNVKISNRDDRQETALNLSTNSISSINMSIEINGVVYTVCLPRLRPPCGVTFVLQHCRMENYKKTKIVERKTLSSSFSDLPADIIEMKVKDGSKIRNLMGYAMSKMEQDSVMEGENSDPCVLTGPAGGGKPREGFPCVCGCSLGHSSIVAISVNCVIALLILILFLILCKACRTPSCPQKTPASDVDESRNEEKYLLQP